MNNKLYVNKFMIFFLIQIKLLLEIFLILMKLISCVFIHVSKKCLCNHLYTKINNLKLYDKKKKL